MSKGEEYTCSACGHTFLKSQTDEEAFEEFNDSFPDEDIEEGVLVCDDCYNEIMGGNYE